MKDIKTCCVPLFLYLLILVSVLFIPIISKIDISLIAQAQNALQMVTAEKFNFISDLHYHYFKIFLVFVSLFLVLKKDFLLMFMYVLFVFWNDNITNFIKNIISRPRPPEEFQVLYNPTTPSFHSGHSFIIMILLGIFMYIVSKHIKNKSLAGLINFVCATWILLVGLSRITLGVHYPSDVFSGYLLGIFFVCVTIKIDKLREE